jgi:hypothetical protein
VTFGRSGWSRRWGPLQMRRLQNTCGIARCLIYQQGQQQDSNDDLRLEHFSPILTLNLGGRNWRILPDNRCEGTNEFCARGPVSFPQTLLTTIKDKPRADDTNGRARTVPKRATNTVPGRRQRMPATIAEPHLDRALSALPLPDRALFDPSPCPDSS